MYRHLGIGVLGEYSEVIMGVLHVTSQRHGHPRVQAALDHLVKSMDKAEQTNFKSNRQFFQICSKDLGKLDHKVSTGVVNFGKAMGLLINLFQIAYTCKKLFKGLPIPVNCAFIL